VKKRRKPRAAAPSRLSSAAETGAGALPLATELARAVSAPPGRPPVAVIEERALPIVTELARVARGDAPPRVKIEGAMEILFGAYGESDPDFSGLFLKGWMEARDDKEFRLTLAWQREQIRLSLEEILGEGVASGALRADLDPGAVAAVILGTAEGCLLQSPTQGGAVTAEQLLRTLLQLIVSGA
jgi:BetI-type transcriptional repressor, C-terminal